MLWNSCRGNGFLFDIVEINQLFRNKNLSWATYRQPRTVSFDSNFIAFDFLVVYSSRPSMNLRLRYKVGRWWKTLANLAVKKCFSALRRSA